MPGKMQVEEFSPRSHEEHEEIGNFFSAFQVNDKSAEHAQNGQKEARILSAFFFPFVIFVASW
jgi:hypothetical protein